MAHHSREEAIKLGITVAPIKHRQTRRASWKKYWMPGTYGITIHVNENEDGKIYKCLLLSTIVGNSNIHPNPNDYLTHPNSQPKEAENKSPHLSTQAFHSIFSCPQASLPESSCHSPHPILTPLGRIIDKKIREIGTHLHEEGVTVTHHVIMPTHIHMIVKVHSTLPYHTVNGKQVRWTLSDIIKGFEKGCTSWFYRMIEGENIDDILSNPSKRRDSKEPPQIQESGKSIPAPSIWHKDGFNDKILMTKERLTVWQNYLCHNAYYWKLQYDYPNLFKHTLHIKLRDSDYSAYGCMFLLERTDKAQVMCHRLARKNMLTEREWNLATQSMQVIQAYERDARDKKLGRFDWDWYRNTNPNSITPIDYTRTEAFRQQKTELLRLCVEEDAVLISPAISRGESSIINEALERGFPVIKLVKDPITEKSHAVNKDRSYCVQAQMLILGPWEIQGNSDYYRFHNLNAMAAELCKGINNIQLDTKELEK